MKLSELKINTYAIILSIKAPNDKIRIRLQELGLTSGTKIRITKIAPFGDPIAFSIRGYELCISLTQASYIYVEPI